MEFWLLDVKSTICVNGKDVGFDYINTYFEEKEAIKEAKILSMDENVIDVSVHKWILFEDGTQEHAEDENGYPIIPFSYSDYNKNYGRRNKR